MSNKLTTAFAYLLLCLGLLACRPAPEPTQTQALLATATSQPTLATATTRPTQAAVSIVHAQPVFRCSSATDLPVYIVAAGDTLYNIAARAGMTLVELQGANCITRGETRLEVGQRLSVRSMPEPLAITTFIPVTEVMPPVITVIPTMFTLTPGPNTPIPPTVTLVVTIVVPTVFTLPPPTSTPIPPTVTPVVTQPALTATNAPTIASCVPRSDWPVYIVVAGDTLYSIATRAGMTVAELMDANCIPRSNMVIFVGQRLYVRTIPAPQATPTP